MTGCPLSSSERQPEKLRLQCCPTSDRSGPRRRCWTGNGYVCTHPDPTPSSYPRRNAARNIIVGDGYGPDERALSDIRGGDEEADVVLDSRRHVVRVCHVPSYGVGLTAGVPAVGADGEAQVSEGGTGVKRSAYVVL